MDKELIFKNIVDCSLAVAISFLSTTLVLHQITIGSVIVNLMTGILIGLIKFREFWTTKVMCLPASKKAQTKLNKFIFF